MKAGSPLGSVLCTLGVLATLTAGGGLYAQTRKPAPTPSPQPQPQPVNFDALPTHALGVPAFSDREIAKLETTLDAKLAATAPGDRWTGVAKLTLWDFARRLQLGRLSAAQETRVLAHLDAIGRVHDAGLVEPARRMVSTLTIGKVAPDIVGADLDGVDFRLNDYRGKVVVLVFTGDWCGICRTEYPYERLLLELYKNWPFAMLGVNSDPDLQQAKQAKIDRDLPYRAWWDGYQEDNTGGPIATSWNVTGWPSIYVIDGQGVIRFVDVHEEDLLKAVHQLLAEQNLRTTKADPSKR